MGYCMLLLNDLCLLGKEMFFSKWFTDVCDPEMCRWVLCYLKWALGVYRHFKAFSIRTKPCAKALHAAPDVPRMC